MTIDVTNTTQHKLFVHFQDIARRIRSGALTLGRGQYSLTLTHGVMQAIHCGYHKIYAVELGVAWGHGLLELCQAAEFFRQETGLDIRVYGIDNATGLPNVEGFRDHPEIWQRGQFNMGDPNQLRARLPSFAKLLIGDVGDVIEELFQDSEGYRLAFASIDVDYYSSTKRLMPIFQADADRYLPATPLYVDDVQVLITYNEWCGEAAAISEFNQENDLRKIDYKPHFHIQNFHVLHVLDHPIRTGTVAPRFPLEIRAI